MDEICKNCLDLRPGYDALDAVWEYDGTIAEAIARGKYGRNPAFFAELAKAARPAFSRFLDITFGEARPSMTAVPMHLRDLRRRGFSQSRVILSILAPKDPYQRPVEKLEESQKQSLLSRDARMKNLQGAFFCREKVTGDWLVIDDVATTGATMHAMARSLKRAGAERVYGFVLARTPAFGESN